MHPHGAALMDHIVNQQAQIIAYIDDYKLLMIATLAVLPLLLVFKTARPRKGEHVMAAE
jgi:MFS transporter, DHA2 family, multidrug resistance protein